MLKQMYMAFSHLRGSFEEFFVHVEKVLL